MVEADVGFAGGRHIVGDQNGGHALPNTSATLGGARALGRDDLGRIAPGAKADLVLVDLGTLSMSPVRDPLKNLVFSASRHDVDTVIVDGRLVVDGGRLEGIDERQLARDVRR